MILSCLCLSFEFSAKQSLRINLGASDRAERKRQGRKESHSVWLSCCHCGQMEENFIGFHRYTDNCPSEGLEAGEYVHRLLPQVTKSCSQVHEFIWHFPRCLTAD